MDPINRKMKMKNVAGFQSFFLTLSFFSSSPSRVGFDRKGFGMRLLQKDPSTTDVRVRAPMPIPKFDGLPDKNGW